MADNRNFFWSKRTEAQNAIVFVGDSLTGNWSNLEGAFPKVHVANRGIGGEVSRGLLFRFKEDALDLHPKAIVMLTGANDLSAKEAPADALSNINDMIDMAHKQSPNMPIVLCTQPPRDSQEAPVQRSQFDELNAGIQKLASTKPGVTLLDLYPAFLSGDGSPDWQNFMPDKLHLGPAGYRKWHDVLVPVFERLKLE